MSELSDRQVTTKARDLTNQAEQGKDISAELNDIPVKDRVRIAHQMDLDNQADRKTNVSLPQLHFAFEREAGQNGQEHLVGIDAFQNPAAPGAQAHHIYHMPKLANRAYELAEKAEKSKFFRRYHDGLVEQALQEDSRESTQLGRKKH
jgi:hypothetical protein